MKTTKDIAELFTAELEKISDGNVRKDVIMGLERCANALIKLARLEMDFAWKNWENQHPNVPWLSTKPCDPEDAPETGGIQSESNQNPPEDKANGNPSTKIQMLEQQIKDAEGQMDKATPTLKRILTDKLNHLRVSHARAVAMEET